MKISAQWILYQLPWLEEIPRDEICKRFSVLGHTLEINEDIWKFTPKTQRSDLHSVNGFFRELSAAFGKVFAIPQPTVQEEDIGSIYEQADVEVWSDTLCNRLTAKMSVELKTGKTPDWMQQRLNAAGISCCGSISDIANYVFLEYGQPILLLDNQSICDGTLTLREAMGFENVGGTDLPYGVPVLESGDEILAVPHLWVSPCGSISDTTRSVIIAAVNYPKDVIALCQDIFGKSTEPTDPLLTLTAVERVCQLIQELGYGNILDGTIDILNFVPNPRKMDFTPEDMAVTGLNHEEFSTFLSLIGITKEGVLPSWRSDLDTKDAVLREITRLTQANTRIKA